MEFIIKIIYEKEMIREPLPDDLVFIGEVNQYRTMTSKMWSIVP